MTKSLEQKIVAALTAEPPPALDRLLTLVAETEAVIIEADNSAEIARTEFFDPVLTPDIHEARDRMESTQHAAERLRTLLPRLQDKAREVEHEADRQEWEIDFGLLADERNALAKELRQLYPNAVAQLVSWFSRAADLDRRLSQLHQTRPPGCKGTLLGAELVARNLTEFSRDTPSLTRELRLPDWQDNKLAWPAREVPASVLLAESMSTSDPRRHSANWFEVLHEDNARRIAEEQQRIAEEQRRSERAKHEYERTLPR